LITLLGQTLFASWISVVTSRSAWLYWKNSRHAFGSGWDVLTKQDVPVRSPFMDEIRAYEEAELWSGLNICVFGDLFDISCVFSGLMSRP
jgi:hypothetical protein